MAEKSLPFLFGNRTIRRARIKIRLVKLRPLDTGEPRDACAPATRQPPRMPMPSIMMGFGLATVRECAPARDLSGSLMMRTGPTK